MSAHYSIRCNDCNAVAPQTSSASVSRARDYNHADGWRNPSRGVDRCPECTKAHKQREAERLAAIPEAHRGYL
jgi:hypothetical protein